MKCSNETKFEEQLESTEPSQNRKEKLTTHEQERNISEKSFLLGTSRYASIPRVYRSTQFPSEGRKLISAPAIGGSLIVRGFAAKRNARGRERYEDTGNNEMLRAISLNTDASLQVIQPNDNQHVTKELVLGRITGFSLFNGEDPYATRIPSFSILMLNAYYRVRVARAAVTVTSRFVFEVTTPYGRELLRACRSTIDRNPARVNYSSEFAIGSHERLH